MKPEPTQLEKRVETLEQIAKDFARLLAPQAHRPPRGLEYEVDTAIKEANIKGLAKKASQSV